MPWVCSKSRTHESVFTDCAGGGTLGEISAAAGAMASSLWAAEVTAVSAPADSWVRVTPLYACARCATAGQLASMPHSSLRFCSDPPTSKIQCVTRQDWATKKLALPWTHGGDSASGNSGNRQHMSSTDQVARSAELAHAERAPSGREGSKAGQHSSHGSSGGSQQAWPHRKCVPVRLHLVD